MKKVEIIEKVLAKEITCEDAHINYSVFNAYRNSKRHKQELLNFDDCIWERDIEPIIQFCKENEIDEITISTTFSGLLETLESFSELGCEMIGLTKVNYVEWDENIKKIPAMKIRITR